MLQYFVIEISCRPQPVCVSVSKQRVDMAKVARAHIATRDELVHAVYPAAWTDMEKESSKLLAGRGTGNLSLNKSLKQNSRP